MKERPGNLLVYGGMIALIIEKYSNLGPGWIFGIMLMIGWAVNEYNKKKAVTKKPTD